MNKPLRTKDVVSYHNSMLCSLIDCLIELSEDTRGNIHENGHGNHAPMCKRLTTLRDDLVLLKQRMDMAYEENI
jgi:hypothetical protein